MTDEKLKDAVPDYVRGRLSDAERRAVEAAAEADPSLAAEIRLFEKIAEQYAADREPGAADELGWARLARAIDAETSPGETSGAGAGGAKVSRRWRYAAILFGVLALGQPAFQALRGDGEDGDARYVTVSEEVSDTHALKVGFVADARAGEIRALLERSRGEIVAGPSALGLYRVSFASAEAKDAALQSYRDEKKIVMTVGEE